MNVTHNDKNENLTIQVDRQAGVQQATGKEPSKHTNNKVQLENRAKRAIARPAYLRDYV